jgi:16S rRNA (adenine1518-N6/adenine1519-N6)-dimethyltransferase
MKNLEKNNKIRAKKSLGQNFLKSHSALKAIIDAGELEKGEIVLEIGPGKGALTEKLLESGAIVFAVEKDKGLIEFLTEKFQKYIENKSFFLIEGDILELDIKSILKNTFNIYKIIANIPYNITGAILKKFLTEENQPERMVLMVQNEVAKRIVANNEPESILSISVKAYGSPKIITKVPARYFSPAPKIDSAIILIKDINKDFFQKNNIKEEIFWQIVKTGFAHKRKKLSSNLKNIIKLDEKYLNARAENLKIEDWGILAKTFK